MIIGGVEAEMASTRTDSRSMAPAAVGFRHLAFSWTAYVEGMTFLTGFTGKRTKQYVLVLSFSTFRRHGSAAEATR
jgi:hypothetical protein